MVDSTYGALRPTHTHDDVDSGRGLRSAATTSRPDNGIKSMRGSFRAVAKRANVSAGRATNETGSDVPGAIGARSFQA